MEYNSKNPNNFNLLSLDFDGPVDVKGDETAEEFEKWADQFEYYRNVYIDNPKITDGKYIITEAARGPKSYLRSVS